MDNPNFSDAIYDCAITCALRRKKGKCKERFGSYECNDCKVYIHRYIDVEPRLAELYIMKADKTVSDSLRSNRSSSIGSFFAIFLLLAVIGSAVGYMVKLNIQRINYRDSWYLESTTPANTARQQNSTHTNIVNTLNFVSRELNKKVDVNRDGLVNCIDAAVLFYQYYPNKNEVTISVNYNTATGMHHLFNVVLIDGIWRAIEPQAYWKNHNTYFMRDIWGSQYDNSKNRVVTDDYLRYVR